MLSVTIEGGAVARFGERFGVTFQRTLRVPDDGRDYPLPPGLGKLPILSVEDFAAGAPAAWRERGGVFIPLRQSEALWLGFRAEEWKPNAVKVGVGGVNAVTGGPWHANLTEAEQDYLVCPPQLWLDGIKSGEGRVRQFVAAPLGEGITVEAQVTGADNFGGIQLVVFEPRAGIFPDAPPPEPLPAPGGPFAAGGLGALPAFGAPPELGIAAGGALSQKIYPDPFGVRTWDQTNHGTLWVHILNAEQYRALTGREPPPTPVSAKTYTEHGLPWFALYDEAAGDLPVAERLARVKSAGRIRSERGAPRDPEDESLDVPEAQVRRLDPNKKIPGRAGESAGPARKGKPIVRRKSRDES